MPDILNVDDSPSMRALVKATLTDAGYSVIQACDGAEALKLAKTNSVNLVLADVNMPNMDGITLVKHLRLLPGYKFTPILMLTTEISAAKKQQAKSVGATGWVVKPFDPGSLLSTVKRAIH